MYDLTLTTALITRPEIIYDVLAYYLAIIQVACSRRSDSGAQRKERRAKKSSTIRTPGTGYNSGLSMVQD